MRICISFFILMCIQCAVLQAQTPEERLTELGIDLPKPNDPVADYVSWRRVDNMVYMSGVVVGVLGKVGEDLTQQEGYDAARLAGIQVIAILKSAFGDLSRVKQFVRVRGMVNSAPNFYGQSQVVNGFSDLMFDVFGEKGKHARTAVGQVSLPYNNVIEIEVTVELEDEK